MASAWSCAFEQRHGWKAQSHIEKGFEHHGLVAQRLQNLLSPWSLGNESGGDLLLIDHLVELSVVDGALPVR